MTSVVASAIAGLVMVPGLPTPIRVHSSQAISFDDNTTKLTTAQTSARSSSLHLIHNGSKLKHTLGTPSRRALPYVELSRRRPSIKPPPGPNRTSHSSPTFSAEPTPTASSSRSSLRRKFRSLLRVPPVPPPMPKGDVPMYLLTPVQPFNTLPRKRLQKPDFDGPPTLVDLKKEGIPLRPDRSVEEPFSAVHGEPTYWLACAENSSSIFPLSEPCRAETSYGRARQIQREDDASVPPRSRRMTTAMAVQPRKRQMPVLYSHAADAPTIIASQAVKHKIENANGPPGPSKLSRLSMSTDEVHRAARHFAKRHSSSTIGYDHLRLRFQFERAGEVRVVKVPAYVEEAKPAATAL